MIRRLCFAAAALALAVAGAALAADPEPAGEAPAGPPVEKPTPEAVRAFWSFYLNGKGQGVVLADAKMCLEVAKEGPSKFECVKEIPAEGVKPGTTVYVWQAYLVPQGDTVEDIAIQLRLGEQIRETKDLKLNGASFRSRNWTAFRIPRAGAWNVQIVRGSATLKSLELTSK